MRLWIFGEAGKSADESAFWWVCNDCDIEIPASEYDWLYWYQDIPDAVLADNPGLKAEWDEAKLAYLNRKR